MCVCVCASACVTCVCISAGDSRPSVHQLKWQRGSVLMLKHTSRPLAPSTSPLAGGHHCHSLSDSITNTHTQHISQARLADILNIQDIFTVNAWCKIKQRCEYCNDLFMHLLAFGNLVSKYVIKWDSQCTVTSENQVRDVLIASLIWVQLCTVYYESIIYSKLYMTIISWISSDESVSASINFWIIITKCSWNSLAFLIY